MRGLSKGFVVRHRRPWLLQSVARRGIFIQTQETPNPDSLKFYPGLRVLESGTADFPNMRSATRSPLARSLLAIEGVSGVFLSTDFVTLNKDPGFSWSQVKPAAFEALMDFFASGKPVIDEGASLRKDTVISDEDDEVTAMVKEILDTRIRPAVQEDGGDIEFVAFKEGVVFLRMQGSCSGCPSSSATLKNGIERMLQHWVPEVLNVMEAPDHVFEEFEKSVENKQ